MISLNHLGTSPMSIPLSADDIVEFHAARLILLFSICGVSGRIDGLTKMAKLDFFARYPTFFEVARAATLPKQTVSISDQMESYNTIESAMVRHHYGPWDKRYYHVLAHLEAKGLITVTKEKKSYKITLTDSGQERARMIEILPSFMPLVERMREIKKVFGLKSGSFLKDLIYRLFYEEIKQRPLGEVIHR